MNYRELGNTGIMVSEIGLGCEGLKRCDDDEVRKIFKAGFERGLNFMDMNTPDPEYHKRIYRILGEDVQNKLILEGHLRSTWQKGQYKADSDNAAVRKTFEDTMRHLHRDYMDLGLIHYVDKLSTWHELCEGGVMDYALWLKKEGYIREIGLSSHNPEVALEALKTGVVKVILFSLNPCYDLQPPDISRQEFWHGGKYEGDTLVIEPLRKKLYETCQREGTAITVMKTFGGGDLLTEEYSPFGRAMTEAQCIHYALTRPAVASVMCGAKSEAEILRALHYEEASDEEKDFAYTFSGFGNVSWKGHCMYCGHCDPCPAWINIADVTKFLNLAKMQEELPETVREHYRALDKHAGDCLMCGGCEERCPFEVNVRQNMREAIEIFGY